MLRFLHKFNLLIYLSICLLSLSGCTHKTTKQRHFPPGVQQVFITTTPDIQTTPLQNIAPLVENSIHMGYYPGAVILAAHNGRIIYRGVFGNRRILPNVAPMRFDTIFDVASLTKVIVTTTAVMQLVEQHKLNLDAPVAQYWPAFAANGKKAITVRELLTHTSGLQEDIPSPQLNALLPASKQMPETPRWYGENAALQEVIALKPRYQPGTTFLYSDVNFMVLGYLVERISGERLDYYAQAHIFKPLGMHDSYFLPPVALRDRITPTQVMDGQLRWGEVHDPSAFLMGGVSGMAGLFSTATDLGNFAQHLLNQGRMNNNAYLLKPSTIAMMTRQQTPANITETRGLGWDINSHFAARGHVFSAASYGHTGWTGTSLWIDPTTQTWLIILTSRTHPIPATKNKLVLDRRMIADMVAESVGSGGG